MKRTTFALKSGMRVEEITINTNQQYTGDVSDYYDVDLYKFTLASSGKVSVNFQHDILTSGEWDVYLLDSGNNTKTSFSNYGSDPNATSWSVRLAAGTYYVKIKSSSSDSYGINYKLKVNYTSENQCKN